MKISKICMENGEEELETMKLNMNEVRGQSEREVNQNPQKDLEANLIRDAPRSILLFLQCCALIYFDVKYHVRFRVT